MAQSAGSVQEESIVAVAFDSTNYVDALLFATTIVGQAKVFDASVSIFTDYHTIWAIAFVAADLVHTDVTAWS